MKTIVLITLLLTIWGCSTNPPIPSTTFVESVKLGEKANRLNQSADSLRENKYKPAVVVAEADKVDVVATELRDDDKRVIALQEQVIASQNDIKNIKEEYQSAVAKSRQAMYATGTWLGGFFALGGLICLVAAIKIPGVGELGSGFAMLGILLISGCQFMSTSDIVPIIIGLVLVLAVVGYVGYRIVINYRTKLAVVEGAKTVELLKTELKKPVVGMWEGDHGLRKIVSQLQSPSTQRIIQHVKKTEINNQI